MTTDNRTNEPTPEQVEAAAKALRDDKANRTDTYRVPEWEDTPYGDKLVYRGQARAALVAAQGVGVAPQEPCPQPCEHLSAEDAREGRDCREHPCTCPTSPFFDREKLIEEARRMAPFYDKSGTLEVARLLTRLADALEAANRERDGATEQAFKKAEAFNKAVALSERRQTLLEAAEAERDAALEAIERVREAHRKFTYYEFEDSCPDTSENHREERHRESDEIGEFYCEDMPTGDVVCDLCRDADGERMGWPCPTIAALAGAPEPDNCDPCDAEVYSWDHYLPEQIDSYWIRCTLLGKHDEHEDSHTGLKWRSGLPVEGENK